MKTVALPALLALGAMLPAAPQASHPASKPVAVHPLQTAWPQFRGVRARGVADGYTTAAKWNVEKGTNVVWKTKIAGLSHSSPIVWGDRVFLTTAVKKGKAELKVGRYGSIKSVPDEGSHKFQVLCLDRKTGKILWNKTAWEGVPKIKRHPKGSHAACTAATDGKHVVAFFGTEGLYCYNTKGKQIWQKDFGVLDSGYYMYPMAQWGFASSPVISRGKVFVQCDIQKKKGFVAAVDIKTGDMLWRTAREDAPTWCTPTVYVGSGGEPQLILNGFKHIGSYDLNSGKKIWWLKGGGDIPVPTPVVSHDRVFITNAHGSLAPIIAVSLAAKGELSLDASQSEHVCWSHLRGGNYMQTPIVVGDELYCCADTGVLSCFDVKTGKRHYKKRLGDGSTGFTASGVAAVVARDAKLYFPSEEGDVFVVQAGTEFEQLAQNALGETCMASPAISRGTLFFRTRSHLMAIAAPQKKAQ